MGAELTLYGLTTLLGLALRLSTRLLPCGDSVAPTTHTSSPFADPRQMRASILPATAEAPSTAGWWFSLSHQKPARTRSWIHLRSSKLSFQKWVPGVQRLRPWDLVQRGLQGPRKTPSYLPDSSSSVGGNSMIKAPLLTCQSYFWGTAANSLGDPLGI